MINRWDNDEAALLDGPVEECAYGSRLLGQDENLVLHGGGNTSVEAPWEDITRSEIPALWVKASGWDLATMPAEGLTPLDLDRLKELAELDELSDPQMMSELAAAQFDPTRAPASVESLVHAVIPHRVVLHTHADAIVGLTNSPRGEERVRETLGDRVVVVPYTMSGFELSKAVRDHWRTDANEGTIGLVLLKHGLFTFGETTEEAYRRHIELLDAAESVFGENETGGQPLPVVDPIRLSRLRAEVSEVAGRPMILTRTTTPDVSSFLARDDWRHLATAGPLTPDHVIRSKPRAMVDGDVAGFASWYRSYFEENRHVARTPVEMLDPAPRLILDEELGLVTVGETIKDANIGRDIATHLLRQAPLTEGLDGYEGLDHESLFEIEYWDLEQAKLKRRSAPKEFTGEVALVTGAAWGIGRGCVAALRARGAAVAGVDLDETVTTDDEADYQGLFCDVTDHDAVTETIATAVERFGGIDMAVFSAGMFGGSSRIAEMDMDSWSRVLGLNTDAIVATLTRLHPHLALSPHGGRVVVIGSKNVPAPGPGAGAYSASKAAITQVARVAALEWADDGIRVNVVHPDGVFDTALWTDELLAERAEKYGMSVDEYKRRNLLSVEVTSASVGEVVAELCGSRFAATTGAQIPIDGGNERVI